jgi:hypothetical protein
LATGRYALTIPGKTGTNGVLLLQNTGYLATQPVGTSNVVDNSYLSYEYGSTNTPANAFIIETRYVDASGGGEGVVGLRDAEFNFVYVDFLNPLAPPGTVPLAFNPPVLSNGQLTISWTGTGTLLQSTNVMLPMAQWTVVPGNPSGSYTVTPATSGPQTYYRLRQ